jgi:hypothetical protein
MKILSVVLGALLLFGFAYYVWPTRFMYFKSEDVNFRTDRFNQHTQILRRDGWENAEVPAVAVQVTPNTADGLNAGLPVQVVPAPLSRTRHTYYNPTTEELAPALAAVKREHGPLTAILSGKVPSGVIDEFAQHAKKNGWKHSGPITITDIQLNKSGYIVKSGNPPLVTIKESQQ